MSKRLDVIKEVREILISSSEKNGGELLATDLAYSGMELSTIKYLRRFNKGVEEEMNSARGYLGKAPCYDWKDEKVKVWKDCVNDYNRLARFYRNQEIDIEPIETHCNAPELTPEILKLRILTKRTFREVERIQGRTSGLSEEEIEKELLKKGLSVRCAI